MLEIQQQELDRAGQELLGHDNSTTRCLRVGNFLTVNSFCNNVVVLVKTNNSMSNRIIIPSLHSHRMWRILDILAFRILTSTVLFRLIVHGVWHMTAIVHWATCSHLPVTNDNQKNCSCTCWWPEMFIRVNNATVTEDPSGLSRNDQALIVQECCWDEKTENWMATSMSNN